MLGRVGAKAFFRKKTRDLSCSRVSNEEIETCVETRVDVVVDERVETQIVRRGWVLG